MREREGGTEGEEEKGWGEGETEVEERMERMEGGREGGTEGEEERGWR